MTWTPGSLTYFSTAFNCISQSSSEWDVALEFFCFYYNIWTCPVQTYRCSNICLLWTWWAPLSTEIMWHKPSQNLSSPTQLLTQWCFYYFLLQWLRDQTAQDSLLSLLAHHNMWKHHLLIQHLFIWTDSVCNDCHDNQLFSWCRYFNIWCH